MKILKWACETLELSSALLRIRERPSNMSRFNALVDKRRLGSLDNDEEVCIVRIRGSMGRAKRNYFVEVDRFTCYLYAQVNGSTNDLPIGLVLVHVMTKASDYRLSIPFGLIDCLRVVRQGVGWGLSRFL